MKGKFQLVTGGNWKSSKRHASLYSIVLEAFSLFLVFSVQTKPNEMLHLNVSRSEQQQQQKHFNAEIHLPNSNWFDHLCF